MCISKVTGVVEKVTWAFRRGNGSILGKLQEILKKVTEGHWMF